MSPRHAVTNWPDVASALRRYAAWMAERGRIEWGPDFFRDDSVYAAGLAQRLETAFREAAHLTLEDATYLTGLATNLRTLDTLLHDPGISRALADEQRERDGMAALFEGAACDIRRSLGDDDTD